MKSPEQGIYRLSRRVENPNAKGLREERNWMDCAHFPPQDGEWNGAPAIDPKDFCLAVRKVLIFDVEYTEIVQQNSYKESGFFIGKVPCREDFAELSNEAYEILVGESLHDRADVPAPDVLIRALKRAPDRDPEKILKALYGPQQDWQLILPELGRVAMDACHEDPSFFDSLLSHARGRIVKRSKLSSRRGFVTYDESGYLDREATGEIRRKESERVLEEHLALFKRLMAHDREMRKFND